MESLSSFIGIDGTNTTLNSGRILINLKPLDERKISASDVIRRLQPELAKVAGHHAVHAAGAGSDGGRSRQPHAVPVHAGRSERGRAEHVRAAACWHELQKLPELRDVASDQQVQGLRARLVFDRDTASRLGITPVQPSTRRCTTPTASARSPPCSRS